MESGSSVEIIASDEAWALARWRDLLVVVWKKTPTVERAGKVGPQVEGMTAGPDRRQVHVVTVIERGAAAPDAETRGLIKKDLRAHDDRIASMAALVLVDGFVGAAVRAVLSAMNVVVRERYPNRVFGAPGEAAGWTAARMGEVGEAEVAAAIELVRSA